MKVLLVSLIRECLKVSISGEKPKSSLFLRFPSLAFANIAALTPEDIQVELLDEQTEPIIPENLKADLVAISVPTSLAPRAYQLSQKFRERGVKVVLGGYHPSLMPEEAEKNADSIVIGDAEETWPELISDFKEGRLKKKYVSTQRRPLDIKIPKREIFKGKGYINTNFVETGRGCVNRCRFCSDIVFYKYHYRYRPIEQVIEDIKSVISWPEKFIFFVDDNIIANRAHAKHLFRALIPLKICWIGQSTLEIAEDEELLRLSAESGCFGLFIGFESFSTDNLKRMNKPVSKLADYKKAVEKIHRYGIAIESGFIVGFDRDNSDTLKEILRFADEVNLDALFLSTLTPIPGTEIFNEYKEQNRIVSEDWRLFNFRNVVIKPEMMTPEALQEGINQLARDFYSTGRVFKRIIRAFFCLIKNPGTRRLFFFLGILAINLAFRGGLRYLPERKGGEVRFK
jgi:radical SAM superfamily enzyme YgiQ (UPF0313 family)